MGFATPVNDDWSINNVTLNNNTTDMIIQPPEPGPARVNFNGVQFQTFEVVDGNQGVLPAHIVVN